MSRQSRKRNQKSAGFNYIFRIYLSLAVSVWLLYHVKHFHDKAHTESSPEVWEMSHYGEDIVRLGRKHMCKGRHGKLGKDIEEESNNMPEDTLHLRKGCDGDKRDETGDKEEQDDAEDLTDEEDKRVDDTGEELETEEEEDYTKA